MDGKLRFLPAAILAGVICACGGGNAVSQSVAPNASPTARQISQAELPNMVLAAGDLGAAYGGFALGPAKSGPQTRDDRINSDCNPQREASELDDTHWVAGYDSEFGPASASSASSDSTFLIASRADLFQDASGGALALQDMMADTLQKAHTECQGVSFGEVAKLEGPTIGDESWASEASFTVASGNATLSGVLTTVAFRQGQVTASVGIATLGNTGASDELVRLARVLAERAK